MEVDFEKLVPDLEKALTPASIFLYGSRARDDFYPESDFEIGVLMKRDNYTHRIEIKKQFNIPGVNIFPFHYEEFTQGNIDTPFQKALYARDLAEGAKTVSGEQIVERLEKPSIMLSDSLQEVSFNLGYALAATHSWRNGDTATAGLHFIKSCLFGTRNYIIFKRGRFLMSFHDVIETAGALELGKFEALPMYAGRVRRREAELSPEFLFLNISYLNQLVEREILEAFVEGGNRVLVG